MAASSHGIQVVERERVAVPLPETGGESEVEPEPSSAGDGGGTVPAAGLGVLAFLTLIVGAWGGIVPFIGPLIGVDADATVSWYWSLAHAWLWAMPGAIACVAAAIMFGAVPRAMVGLGRVAAFGAGVLAVCCGAWFVIGPAAWPVLVRTAGVFVPAGPLSSLAREFVYSYGPGTLLLVLGAIAMGTAGRVSRRRRDIVVSETPARVVPRSPLPA